jgi:hypothetical protein
VVNNNDKTMPLVEWYTQYTNPFPQLFHSTKKTVDSSMINPTGTQAVIPTLSFDLAAPTAASAGWTVKNVWAGDGEGSNDFALKLEDILNRTETFSILDSLLYRHIIAVLVVAWSVLLWRKLRSTGTRVSWRDGLAVAMVLTAVVWRVMAVAIGCTAAYAAWSTLADRPWSLTGGLPGFDAFVASLRPVRGDGDREEEEGSNSNDTKPLAVSLAPPAEPNPEVARLARIEANLGLPETKPEEECVVCWSSSSDEEEEEDPPLQLPCSHLVCKSCLIRLKDANRYLCPFCRLPLYTLTTTKAYLFQASVASSGAQLSLALLLAALQIAKYQYWGAAGCLLFKAYPAAAALVGSWEIRGKGEEGFFASTSESGLKVQLAFSVYLLWATYGGVDEVGWATFVDGKLVRAGKDEWRFAREVVCWAVPALARKVVSC